ncbi:MAG: type I-E CRISPR-associated protein Cas6/Cse3/CasE [Actinomycetia bacterium]|nr:type I-E CRISPR-associated protein Cas6/Cse3/CasE [Actinomycetes bacterium]
MWFSSITFDMADRGTRELLNARQRLHAAVMRTSTEPREGADRVLWRLDHKPETLFIVSPAEPDLTVLTRQCPDATARSAPYDRFLATLSVGSRWRFRATVNPVRSLKSVGRDKQNRGKRVALLKTSLIEDWFAERGAAAGFTIPVVDGERTATVTRREHLDFAKKPNQAQVRLATAQLEGLLEVTDADALRTALTCGIGRARAYGCGLLTLARLR